MPELLRLQERIALAVALGESHRGALKQRRPQMTDVWYAWQIAGQAVTTGSEASTIRKHMTGRPGAVARHG